MPATLADIARETGFARSSVAEVLQGRPGYSPKTRQRILDAAARLDFVPNHLGRSLKKQRSHTIGVAARMSNAINTGPMLHAMAESLQQSGFMPLFADTSGRDADAAAIRELRGRSVDGMILNCDLSEPELSRLVPASVPVVMVRSVPQAGRPSVVVDRFEAYRRGVQWLVQRGHRRIAFVGSECQYVLGVPFNSQGQKIRGYQAAMRECGLEDPDLLVDVPNDYGATRQRVVEHRALFDGLTAVLASNDRVALEVMSGLADLGRRVPEDCSVIGFDDTAFAPAMKPTLTSFNPLHVEAGRHSVQMVLDLLEGKQPESVYLVPQLMERESAGARH